MVTRIQVRRDIAINWSNVNPILASGEFGFETDTYSLKIGDGETAWNSLDYFAGDGSGEIVSNRWYGQSPGLLGHRSWTDLHSEIQEPVHSTALVNSGQFLPSLRGTCITWRTCL